MYDYGECHVCGEPMREARIKQDFWVKGKLVVVEAVPAGVCPNCGEKIVRAAVGRQIAELLRGRNRTQTKTIQVPVLRYKKETA